MNRASARSVNETMKTLLLLALLSATAFAQNAQPLKGTIANLGSEPAPYVPDDSLAYSVPLRPIELLTAAAPVVLVPVLAILQPVAPVAVAPAYPAFFGGYGYHPRPAANGGHAGHLSVSRGRR